MHLSRRHKAKAFTLIELLVVIFIISLSTTFIILNLGGQSNRPHNLDDYADHMQALFVVAQEQAVLQPAEIGVVFYPDAYEFMRYVFDTKTNEGHWAAITDDDVLGFRSLPHDMNIEILHGLKYEDDVVAPQIVFHSSGDISPFEIEMGNIDALPRYRIIGKSNGDIQLIDLKNQS